MEGCCRCSYILHGQPKSLRDEEQHWEVQTYAWGYRGCLSWQRERTRETLGKAKDTGKLRRKYVHSECYIYIVWPLYPSHVFLHLHLWETQEVFDAALAAESSSDWSRAVQRWKECVNETLKQTDECRAQCVVTSQLLPEETDNIEGVYEKAAGENRRMKENSCVWKT